MRTAAALLLLTPFLLLSASGADGSILLDSRQVYAGQSEPPGMIEIDDLYDLNLSAVDEPVLLFGVAGLPAGAVSWEADNGSAETRSSLLEPYGDFVYSLDLGAAGLTDQPGQTRLRIHYFIFGSRVSITTIYNTTHTFEYARPAKGYSVRNGRSSATAVADQFSPGYYQFMPPYRADAGAANTMVFEKKVAAARVAWPPLVWAGLALVVAAVVLIVAGLSLRRKKKKRGGARSRAATVAETAEKPPEPEGPTREEILARRREIESELALLKRRMRRASGRGTANSNRAIALREELREIEANLPRVWDDESV